MACSCCRSEGHHVFVRSPILRSTLSVSYRGARSDVRIAALRIVREAGRRLVSLFDVWSATPRWESSLDELRFDFVGDDGFDTAAKAGKPLRGGLLREGFVDVETRDVVWGVDVPCFYRVKGLREIVARAYVPVTT
jgi:hypothetical protein